jgi:DNA polymerase III subunit beta
MKFTCSKEDLDRQLQHVSRVVTVRQSLPVLSNVLLETDGSMVRISGTDMELAVTTQVPAIVEQEGAFTVPAKVFLDFVHQNPDGELTFKLEGVELVCSSAKVQGRITGLDPEEYPELPKVEEKQRLAFEGQPFIEAVRRVVVAAATDAARPVLTGVLMKATEESVTLAATDSFRLAERSISGVPVTEEYTLLVPARTVQEVGRIMGSMPEKQGIELIIGESQVIFRIGGVDLYSRLLVGKFPQYQAIIPQTFVAEADVSAQELTQALRLATIFSTAGTANVLLEVDESGSLTLSSYGSQRGSARHTLMATLKDGFVPVRAAFNTRFLLDAVGAASAEFVSLKFSGSTSPLVIATEDTAQLQLVMPIRLDR